MNWLMLAGMICVMIGIVKTLGLLGGGIVLIVAAVLIELM